MCNMRKSCVLTRFLEYKRFKAGMLYFGTSTHGAVPVNQSPQVLFVFHMPALIVHDKINTV